MTQLATETRSLLPFGDLSMAVLVWVVDDAFGTLGSYPMGIFGAATQRVLTYGMPVAFVAFLGH